MKLASLAATAAVAAAAFGAPAFAADGQLYYASIVQGSVKVFIDDKQVSTVPYGKIDLIDVTPGTHRLRVVSEAGQSAEKTVEFRADQLASSKGGQWWCAATMSPENSTQVVLIVMDKPSCQKFVDDGN